MSEFSRQIPLDTIGEGMRELTIEADAAECAALARRFGWSGIERLTAEARVVQAAGGVTAKGMVCAVLAQPCVVTGTPVSETVEERFDLRFVRGAGEGQDGEVELDEGELDVLPIDGGAIDLGEAVAQTLALAVDPYPKAPDADVVAKDAGVLSEEEAKSANSPFAKLQGLLDG